VKGGLRVAVIGGGIAGLTAAYRLRRGADETGGSVRLTVLEAAGRWGGKIHTERRDGFVLEAGPDTFVSTKPWGLALCRELGLEDRLRGANMERRKVFVRHRGRLVQLPDGLAMMVPSRIGPFLATPLLSPLGKLRLAMDWVLPPGREDGDESLAAFITRRMGRQVYDRLIEPLMSGIYAGDGERLSLRSTFPYLREWERREGSLARGARKAARPPRGDGRPPAPHSVFLTLAGGLGEMVDALLARLAGTDLRLEAAVHRIDRRKRGFRLTTGSGEILEADGVIVAAPAFAAGRMLESVDPQLAGLLQEIEYVSTATVSLAYRVEDLPRPLDGHGYVIPRIEGRKALACTWTSTKFPHRAPDGHALLRVFIGRAGVMDDPDLDEATLIAVARQEVAETLEIHGQPVLARVARWPFSMPQFNLGHPRRLQDIASRLVGLPGLRLAGAAYGGIGIPDCIQSGEWAAKEILAAGDASGRQSLALAREMAT
jgi:oxygen-dependent protoporphyrinogen oxidase